MDSYLRLGDPTRIRRFRRLHWGVTFSSQTFATTSWLKKPEIHAQRMTKVTGGMFNSQIATDRCVSPPRPSIARTTVSIRQAQAGHKRQTIARRRRLTVTGIVGRCLFAAQIGLGGCWASVLPWEVRRRALNVSWRHELKYAV
ncbi:MAG: hypothetical protein R6X25_10210 [Candidatus Krumholzibacteriia bacterium]